MGRHKKERLNLRRDNDTLARMLIAHEASLAAVLEVTGSVTVKRERIEAHTKAQTLVVIHHNAETGEDTFTIEENI